MATAGAVWGNVTTHHACALSDKDQTPSKHVPAPPIWRLASLQRLRFHRLLQRNLPHVRGLFESDL
jgi:hypothetical protein